LLEEEEERYWKEDEDKERKMFMDPDDDNSLEGDQEEHTFWQTPIGWQTPANIDFGLLVSDPKLKVK